MAITQAVQAVATPLATVAPSIAPAVHAVAAHAAAAPAASGLNGLLNKLTTLVSPTDIVVIAGVIAAGVQSFINRIPWLKHDIAQVQDARRTLLAVVLPFAGTYITSLASGQNTTGAAPWIFLVSLVLFRAIKLIQATSTGTVATAQLATPAAPQDGGSGEIPAIG